MRNEYNRAQSDLQTARDESMQLENKISEINSELSLASHYKQMYEDLMRDGESAQRSLIQQVEAKDLEIEELRVTVQTKEDELYNVEDARKTLQEQIDELNEDMKNRTIRRERSSSPSEKGEDDSYELKKVKKEFDDFRKKAGKDEKDFEKEIKELKKKNDELSRQLEQPKKEEIQI